MKNILESNYKLLEMALEKLNNEQNMRLSQMKDNVRDQYWTSYKGQEFVEESIAF